MSGRGNNRELEKAPDRKEKSKLSCLREKLGERVITPFLLGVLENLAFILPPPAIKRLAFISGNLFYRFSDLQLAKTQWIKVMGEKEEKVVNRHLQLVFHHLALSVMELMLLKRKGERVLEYLVEEVEGEEFLKEALSRSQGGDFANCSPGKLGDFGSLVGQPGLSRCCFS